MTFSFSSSYLFPFLLLEVFSQVWSYSIGSSWAHGHGDMDTGEQQVLSNEMSWLKTSPLTIPSFFWISKLCSWLQSGSIISGIRLALIIALRDFRDSFPMGASLSLKSRFSREGLRSSVVVNSSQIPLASLLAVVWLSSFTELDNPKTKPSAGFAFFHFPFKLAFVSFFPSA